MAAKALSFDVGDYVVYPKHGVGRVVELQSTEIAGTRLDLMAALRNSHDALCPQQATRSECASFPPKDMKDARGTSRASPV